MRLSTSSVFLACLFSVSSVAQQSSALSGNWKAKYPAPNGALIEASIVVKGDTGTFYQPVIRGNPCTGRDMPISIDKVTADGFELVRNSSKVMAGCPDVVWQLKRVDDKTFETTFPDGRKALIVRE